jgi:hypothetical protein
MRDTEDCQSRIERHPPTEGLRPSEARDRDTTEETPGAAPAGLFTINQWSTI